MRFFYQIFITLYPIVAKLISGKNEKARLWVDGRKDTFKRLEEAFATNKSEVLWIHCSSLGEFEQGRPIIEEIKKSNTSIKILITFFSPSGYEIRKNYEHADWVFYLPMDSATNATRFLDIVKPSLVVFVKYEFWYYYLKTIHQRNIPLLLVSGIFRDSQPFFKWYGNFNRQILNYFTKLFVQNEDSVDLLKSIGITDKVVLSGDTRFDRVFSIAQQFDPIATIETFIGNHQQVIVCGSTWLEDDEVLYHYAKTHPHVLFIIAPHDIQQARIEECVKLYPNAVRFSDFLTDNRLPLTEIEVELSVDGKLSTENQREANILIINNIGMLSRLYKYATICFVGGGFGDDGVHNVLEAAVYGKPVVFGPEYSKYFEAIALVDNGGGFSVESTIELEKIFNSLFNDTEKYNAASNSAGNYVYENVGATSIITKYIYENRLLTN